LLLLAGAVTTFEAVFNYRTSYMNVLMLRYLCRLPVDTPDRRAALGYLATQYFPEGFVIEEFAELEGAEFFDKALQLLVGGESSDPTLGSI
jgi:hypothetical protein